MGAGRPARARRYPRLWLVVGKLEAPFFTSRSAVPSTCMAQALPRVEFFLAVFGWSIGAGGPRPEGQSLWRRTCQTALALDHPRRSTGPRRRARPRPRQFERAALDRPRRAISPRRDAWITPRS